MHVVLRAGRSDLLTEKGVHDIDVVRLRRQESRRLHALVDGPHLARAARVRTPFEGLDEGSHDVLVAGENGGQNL